MFIKSAHPAFLSMHTVNICLLFSTFICLLSPQKAKAQGDLFINPKRIVFDGQKRSQEISLANIGNDTAHYMVSFIQIRLKENGEFEQIEKPDSGQYFADKYLRIFPRTITLAPKETQVVKIQTYQKENLAPGEYRSHLYFRATQKDRKAIAEPIKKEDSNNLSVNITAVFGITIPVIIEIGESNTTASITNLKLQTADNTTPKLFMRLNRQGNRSTYGDINIDYISASGKTTNIAFVKGISVYAPYLIRNIAINLNNSKSVNSQTGKLLVTYTGTKDGKPEKLASAELNL